MKRESKLFLLLLQEREKNKALETVVKEQQQIIKELEKKYVTT